MVIAIITVLATLAVSAVYRAKISNQIRIARTSGTRLAQAIEAYKVHQGFLPLQVLYDAETDGDGVYENCDLIGQINGVMNREPFLELAPGEMDPAGSFKDPWGRAFRVVMWKENASDALNRYFQVYSCGPNRKWEMGRNDPAASDKPDDIVPRH